MNFTKAILKGNPSALQMAKSLLDKGADPSAVKKQQKQENTDEQTTEE